MGNVESSTVEPIKIPLCAYVEEEIEEMDIDPMVNQTVAAAAENKAFLDPHLGCVLCQIQPLKQCVKKPPQKTCQMVTDPECHLCPKVG